MNLKLITEHLSSIIKINPKICILLGSGLNYFAENIRKKITIPYSDIPTFYQTSSTSGEMRQYAFWNI